MNQSQPAISPPIPIFALSPGTKGGPLISCRLPDVPRLVIPDSPIHPVPQSSADFSEKAALGKACNWHDIAVFELGQSPKTEPKAKEWGFEVVVVLLQTE